MSQHQPIEEEYIDKAMNMADCILSVVVFITIGIAYILSLSYMNSVSLAKKCLLLYLYKDMFSSIVWIRFLKMIEAVLGYWYSDGTSEILVFLVSYGTWFGILYSALIFICIRICKFYMAKRNAIDPTIPFIDENEVSAIRNIRITSSVLVIGFLSTTFGLGLYPDFPFFTLKPDEQLREHWTISNMVYRFSIILLVSLGGIITIAERCYEAKTDLQIDKIIPRAIKYSVTLSLFVVMGFIISDITDLADTQLAIKISQIVVSILLILGPIVMIMRSNQLKSHSFRVIKNKCYDALMLSIYLVPTCIFILTNVFVFIFC